jgi:hypothetical protein
VAPRFEGSPVRLRARGRACQLPHRTPPTVQRRPPHRPAHEPHPRVNFAALSERSGLRTHIWVITKWRRTPDGAKSWPASSARLETRPFASPSATAARRRLTAVCARLRAAQVSTRHDGLVGTAGSQPWAPCMRARSHLRMLQPAVINANAGMKMGLRPSQSTGQLACVHPKLLQTCFTATDLLRKPTGSA